MLYLAKGFAGTRPKEKGNKKIIIIKGKMAVGGRMPSPPLVILYLITFLSKSQILHRREPLHFAWEELFNPTGTLGTEPPFWLCCLLCQTFENGTTLMPGKSNQEWSVVAKTDQDPYRNWTLRAMCKIMWSCWSISFFSTCFIQSFVCATGP